MAFHSGALGNGVTIPSDVEPFQAVDDGVDRFLSRPREIRILDAQQKAAAVVMGKEPIEKSRARAADMEEPGGRRSKSGDDGHGENRTLDDDFLVVGASAAMFSTFHGPGQR